MIFTTGFVAHRRAVESCRSAKARSVGLGLAFVEAFSYTAAVNLASHVFMKFRMLRTTVSSPMEVLIMV
jgi:hypothetical protein